MTPLLLSLTFAIGVWLLYDGLTRPAQPRGSSRPGMVARFLIRAGLPEVTPRDFVAFSFGSGIVGGALTQLVLGWPVVSALAAGLATAMPFAYYLQRHDRQQAAMRLALVEAIGQLRDGIRSGLSIQDAVRGLATHGPEALQPAFRALARESSLDGFEPALIALRERLADPAFDTVAASLLLTDRLGGHVSPVLHRLAHATRAQLRVQDELRAYQARHVLSARIVAAVPLVVLIGVRQVDPGYLDVFSTGAGQFVLAGCLVSVIVGYAAMLWVSRLPAEPRVY